MEAEFEHLTRRAKTKVKVRDDVVKGPSRRGERDLRNLWHGSWGKALGREAELRRLEKVREKRLGAEAGLAEFDRARARESASEGGIQTDARREPRGPCSTTEEDAGRRAALLLPAARRERRESKDLG